MKIWFKICKENKLKKDTIIEDFSDETRTHKIIRALDDVCVQFDLSRPIWLDKTIADFKKNADCRFYAENFIDEIDFDYLEMQVIEEDPWL